MNTCKNSIDNKSQGQEVRIFCIDCKRPTDHKVMHSCDSDWSTEFDEFYVHGFDSFQIVRCLGCKSTSFRHVNYCSENHDSEDDGITEKLYPERENETIPTKEFWKAPRILRGIYQETVDALNNECYTLCAAGLRAIVEGLCADQGVTNGPVQHTDPSGNITIKTKSSLEGKISGLCEKGILTKKLAETLHEHRYLGNEAVHQLEQPSLEELKLALGIIEHALEQVYEIPEKADRLKAKHLKRRNK